MAHHDNTVLVLVLEEDLIGDHRVVLMRLVVVEYQLVVVVCLVVLVMVELAQQEVVVRPVEFSLEMVVEVFG